MQINTNVLRKFFQNVPPHFLITDADKHPRYLDGSNRSGEQGGEKDRSRLASLEEALAIKPNIGVALLEDTGLLCVDIDHCLTEDGELKEGHDATEIVEKALELGLYIEISYSGTGLHIFGLYLGENQYRERIGSLEIYTSKQFIALTGNLWRPEKVADSLLDTAPLLPFLPEPKPVTQITTSSLVQTTIVTKGDKHKFRAALYALDPSAPGDANSDWFLATTVAAKLYRDSGDPEISHWWDEWSKEGGNRYDNRANFARFNSLLKRPGSGQEYSLRSLLKRARERLEGEEVTPLEQLREEEIEALSDITEPIPFEDYSRMVTSFVLDEILEEGFIPVAGEPGVGKSTVLLPFLSNVTGLTPTKEYHPKHKRHLIWVTEAEAQALSTLHAMSSSDEEFLSYSSRIHLYPASRKEPKKLVSLLSKLVRKYSEPMPNGTVLRPLVVLDTASTNVALENESDNAEVANLISTLRRSLKQAPVVVIGHTPKASSGETAENLSMRGGSAWSGDSTQTLFVARAKASGRVYIQMGKVRFKPKYEVFTANFHQKTCILKDPYDGQKIQQQQYWSEVEGKSLATFLQEEEEYKQEQKENQQNTQLAELMQKIEEALEEIPGVNAGTLQERIKGVGNAPFCKALSSLEEQKRIGKIEDGPSKIYFLQGMEEEVKEKLELAKLAELEERMQQIEDFLRETPGANVSSLRKGLKGIGNGALFNLLSLLEEQGRVKVEEKGQSKAYFLNN